MLADLRIMSSDLYARRIDVENFYNDYASQLTLLKKFNTKGVNRLANFKGGSDEYEGNLKVLNEISKRVNGNSRPAEALIELYKKMGGTVKLLNDFNEKMSYAAKSCQWLFRGIDRKYFTDPKTKSGLPHKASEIGTHWTVDPEVGLSFSGNGGPVFATATRELETVTPRKYMLSDVRHAKEMEVGLDTKDLGEVLCFVDQAGREEIEPELRGADISYRDISEIDGLAMPL